MPYLIGEEDTLLAKEIATIEETITIISNNKEQKDRVCKDNSGNKVKDNNIIHKNLITEKGITHKSGLGIVLSPWWKSKSNSFGMLKNSCSFTVGCHLSCLANKKLVLSDIYVTKKCQQEKKKKNEYKN